MPFAAKIDANQTRVGIASAFILQNQSRDVFGEHVAVFGVLFVLSVGVSPSFMEL